MLWSEWKSEPVTWLEVLVSSVVFSLSVQSQQWVCCCTKHGGCNNSRDDWKVGWVAWLILPRHHYPGVTMLVGWTNVLHEQNRALFYVASRFLSVGIWIKNVEIKEVIILWVDLLVLLLAEKVMHFIFARLKKANLYSKCLEMWNLILTALASNHLPCAVAERVLKSSMVSIQENLEWNLPLSPIKLWQPTVQEINSEISFSCGYSRKHLWICSARVSLFSSAGLHPHRLWFWSTDDEYMLLMKCGFKITY